MLAIIRRSNVAYCVPAVLCIFLITVSGEFVMAQNWDQTITLNPGWNSIYLEVQPEDYDPPSIFGGMEVASVWTWAQRQGSADYISDPSGPEWNQSQWLVWAPEGSSEHIATNLHALFSGRAYMVHFTGSSPRSFTVSGVPNIEKIKWVPDSYNLTGFHLDPVNPPSFAAYFAPSPAHTGQAMYRLQPNGHWAQVNPADPMKAGEAYWVYTLGTSAYNGPLMVELPGNDGLDYDAFQQKYQVNVKNIGSPGSITLEMLQTPTPVALNYRDTLDDAQETIVWPAFDAPLELDAPTDQAMRVEFSVDRTSLQTNEASSVMEIRDGHGSRWLVPVKAKKTSREAFTGLWIGNVQITAVSESQVGSLIPKPVYRPFTFRIMIHVDAFGQARLLKEVIQLWEDGTYVVINDASGNPTPLYEIGDPGHYVLITDNSLIPNFQAAGVSDGDPVGYRVSTAAYDFEGTDLAMGGMFDFMRTLTVELVLEPNHPTNPFFDKFHPDHNNLDEHFLPLPEGFEEAFRIVRQFQLYFAELDPEGVEMGDGSWNNKPGWGSTIMGGDFSETISGVHKNDIVVQGTFRLNLVSTTDSLNPGGTK